MGQRWSRNTDTALDASRIPRRIRAACHKDATEPTAADEFIRKIGLREDDLCASLQGVALVGWSLLPATTLPGLRARSLYEDQEMIPSSLPILAMASTALPRCSRV
jgi:hypothetical protein